MHPFCFVPGVRTGKQSKASSDPSWAASRVGKSNQCSAELIHVLGPQDIVVANNFLCHMAPLVAENCLRNIAGLVDQGGYLFVSGVDLEVLAKGSHELGV